ncbi:aspartate-semialdehyde dehydrogenase [Lasius niger]|uniref:Aspartate-semialdehyde dehydrogenase n=1 Tax=Lasius niger TaxID=67767 RepID=A0A0J7JVD2_LASNI|nr:aspartate-semialdehyde dehydrogenase [Lasius niger]
MQLQESRFEVFSCLVNLQWPVSENLPEITVDVHTHDLYDLDEDDEMDRLVDCPVSLLARDAIEQVEEQYQIKVYMVRTSEPEGRTGGRATTLDPV